MPRRMPHSLLKKMHEYKAQPQFYPWHVYFQVLNNLENAANGRREVVYATSFIETRQTKLDEAVCIYAVFSHT